MNKSPMTRTKRAVMVDKRELRLSRLGEGLELRRGGDHVRPYALPLLGLAHLDIHFYIRFTPFIY